MLLRWSACVSTPICRNRPQPAARTRRMMLWLRSIVFNVVLYVTTIAICILALPTLLLPYRYLMATAKLWARINLALLRAI